MEALEVSLAGPLRSRKLFDAYFARGDVPERLVLLFDEFDRYAEGGFPSSQGTHAPGRAYFNDLESARRSFRGLGVLAAGSIDIYVFRDVLRSSFLSRAERGRLGPFDREAVTEFARPFADRGAALGDDVIDALLLASGGIPALLTYGLEQLWDLAEPPVESHVTGAFVPFQESHSGYLDDVRQSFSDPRLSQAPQRVLELIRQSPGPLFRDQLEAACEVPGDALKLNLCDVLDLLRAAGLVHLEGSVFRDNPLEAHPIPSLLNPPTATPLTDTFREDFLRDLTTLLEKLHRSSVDFFRPGKNGGKVLVPESVFAAHLALGFELLGWRTEREAQSAAGRTDLKLRRTGSHETAVVEVKIWGRATAKDAQRQILGYWTSETAAGAVVMLTDAEPPEWPSIYGRECLDFHGTSTELQPVEGRPIRVRFQASSQTANELDGAGPPLSALSASTISQTKTQFYHVIIFDV